MKKECPPEGRNCVERNRQRAGAGRVAERKPPRARGLPPQRILRAEPSWAGTLLSRIPGGGPSSTLGGTLLNILLEIGMPPECPPWECPREPSKNSATWIVLLPIRKEE